MDANVRCIPIAKVTSLINFLGITPSFAFISSQKITSLEKKNTVRMRITMMLLKRIKKKMKGMMMWLMMIKIK